jgi:ABC-type nitrate/sulfonate/bicarbonate transport system permease component
MRRETVRPLVGVGLLLTAWESLMRFGSGHHAVPAPSAIVMDYWLFADVYIRHIAGTVPTAAIGFLFGNAVAIGVAVLLCHFSTLERILRGVNLTLFVIPMLVIGPLLVSIFRGDEPQIILAAIAVYFPTMAATLVGLRDVDPRLLDVVDIYGGSGFSVMRFVRLRSALPTILAGFRVASSAAVLGAILGEFGSGVRWGLGSFLLGSLPEGIPARLWGIGFAATAISMTGYLVFSTFGRRVLGSTVSVTIANKLPDDIGTAKSFGSLSHIMIGAISVCTPFFVWWALVRGAGLSPIIAPGPPEVVRYLFFSPNAGAAQSSLLTALAATLPAAGLGLLFGLAAAFGLASLSVLRPQLIKAVVPPALMLQSTPLVALAPIMLLIFGRDMMASVVTAVIVTFFGAFVVLTQGFELVPRAARELVQVYGGGRGKDLALVSIPFAIKYLFTAAKLVAPRALLGVMVAEWLFTGTGLGHLVDVARGQFEFELAWAGALSSILVAVIAYQAVGLAERLVR